MPEGRGVTTDKSLFSFVNMDNLGTFILIEECTPRGVSTIFSGAESSLLGESVLGVSRGVGGVSKTGSGETGSKNNPPDVPPPHPDDGEPSSGVTPAEVTVTVSEQFTTRESGPEVTVTVAVLLQIDE